MLRFDVECELSMSGYYNATLTYTPKVEKDGCGHVVISKTGDTRNEAIYNCITAWLEGQKEVIEEDAITFLEW